MMDKRVAFQRDVLEGLLESLDAALRVERWPEQEAAPPALQASAANLHERLGVANRLAKDTVTGAPAAKRIMEEICTAIRFLDDAYVKYRRGLSGSLAEQQEAAGQLESGIARVRGNSRLWS
jgi:hypothetical protein